MSAPRDEGLEEAVKECVGWLVQILDHTPDSAEQTAMAGTVEAAINKALQRVREQLAESTLENEMLMRDLNKLTQLLDAARGAQSR